jgi:chromosome segregation ATPase
MMLQDKQVIIAKTMTERPDVFSDENIKNFPGNRQLLKTTAQEQIESLNQVIQLYKEQIAKLKEIEALPIDKNFLEYSNLNRQTFEKTLERNQLRIQKFQLILDNNLTDKHQLEKSILSLSQKESEIDSTITQLENQIRQLRIATGK